MSSTQQRNYMKAIKILLISALMTSLAHAQVTCQSVPTASCLTEGMCFEFFESEVSDPEVWENLCEEVEGTYSNSPCDMTKTAVKCLTSNNIIVPVVHFLKDFSVDEATQYCAMTQGTVCK